MKNTMNIKSLLSIFVPAAMMSLVVASCSDYDNGYDTNAIKFREGFINSYGDIDPKQDWNLADRGKVTVTPNGESEVKIYALRGNEYILVGDYEGVRGAQELGFDMVEGTENIVVTDGVTAIHTKVGGSANFMESRTTNSGTFANNAVTVSLITNDKGEPIERNGVTVTYPKYKEATQSTYNSIYSVVPEIGYEGNGYRQTTNLHRVANNFSYVSTGDFIIYPLYWVTSSTNTIGVYFTDASGYHEVDIYTNKKGGELQYYANGYWQNYEIPSGQSDSPTWGYAYNIFQELGGSKVRGQGIRVHIPEGTVFGMYLKKSDNDFGECKFYSESSKNTGYNSSGKDPYGPGVVDYGTWVNWEDWNSKPSYASTFTVPGVLDGDELFLGFEDWPNGSINNSARQCDFDLNDMIFAFDGCKPTIINEDPTVNSFMVVCEDLGGGFDTDYNDVIFKVEHVSGQTTAKVTPMAAGGTLASFIFLNDQLVGEIHQLFGATPEASGDYAPINATSRYEKTANPITVNVAENWTMSYSTEVNSDNVNMGGFLLRTLVAGTPDPGANVSASSSVFYDDAKASVIAAPDAGDAPYMLCIPATYTKDENGVRNTYVWAWPVELCTICSATYNNGKYQGSTGGAYLDFGAWVTSYSDNRDWYKNPNTNGAGMTVETLLLSSQNIGNGGNNGGNNGGKQASNLALNSSANLNLTQGNTSVNLNNYITTSSTGAISFTIYTLDRSQHVGANSDGTFNFYNGSGIVVVHQEADGNYEAGDLEFTITVGNGGKQACPLAVKNGATSFTITKDSNGDAWADLDNYFTTSSTGAISITVYTPDRVNQATPNSEGMFNFKNGSGIVVVHQNADNNYEAGEVEFTINVSSSSGGGDWTTLTNQGPVYGNGSSYFLSDILDACSTGSQVEFKVTGNNEGYITLILIAQDGNPNWSYQATNNRASGETLIVDKTTLQGWLNSGVGTKVFMQNPSTSVQVRPL